MSAKISTLMPSSSGTARRTRRAAYEVISRSLESGGGAWGRSGAALPPSQKISAQPGVLEPQLERRQGRRTLDVGLHPVALQLVAEDDQRALFLEPAHQLRVHLLARGRARGEAEGVEPPVGLLRLEAAEVPGRGGVLHRVVEHVGIDGDAPVAARDVELLADQLLEVLPRLERADVERDAALLELLAQDLAVLHEHRHLRLDQVGQAQAAALARVGQELLGPGQVGAALVGVHPGGPRARLRRGLGGHHVAVVVDELHDLGAVDGPRDGLPQALVVVGPAGPEVLVPALERDVVVLHPLHEPVGPGADREELRILLGERLLVDDLGGLRQHREERSERPAQGEAHLVRADRLHPLHRREEHAHRQLVLGIEQPVEREGHVLGGERLAVVEDRVVHQVEDPGLLPVGLPGLGEPGNELASLVHVDQLVVDVLVNLQRRVELGEARIHVDRLVDGGDLQDAAALGLALRPRGTARDPAERGEPGARGEPAHARQPLPARAPVPARGPLPVPHRPFLPWMFDMTSWTSPSFMTTRTWRSARMSASGSPSTASRSARLPGATAPTWSATRQASAPQRVPESSASRGETPNCTRHSSSKGMHPCTPSVPEAKRTPEARWAGKRSAITRRAARSLSMIATWRPSPPSMPRSCMKIEKVQMSQAPWAFMRAMSSSVARPACSIVETPSSTHRRRPGPPWAWAAAYFPARSASSPAARISSRE